MSNTKQNKGESDSSRVLTAADLANRWNVTQEHVRKMAREKKIPSFRFGKTFRFYKDEIEIIERVDRVTLDEALATRAQSLIAVDKETQG